MFFTSNLDLISSGTPDPSVLSVQAGGMSLPVENVGLLSGLNISYIVVRLPDGLTPGDLLLMITLRGVASSNSPILSISP